MSETLQKKIDGIKIFFTSLTSQNARYEALINMGRNLPPFPSELKTPEHLVAGCQSNLYLRSRLADGLMLFEATSDALISAGLAALLIAVYGGESPEIVLKHTPLFLFNLGIHTSLSQNRSSGLSNIHLKMKQEALKCLIYLEKS